MTTDVEVSNATFLVRLYRSPQDTRPYRTGTGFLVNDEYHVLTAAHNVDDLNNNSEAFAVIAIGKEEFSVKVKQQFSADTDIVLLQLEKPLKGVKPLGFADSIDDTQAIRIQGFPSDVGKRSFSGMINNQSTDIRYTVDLTDQPEYSLQGISGAPVLDANNDVIGVFVRHRPTDNFAEFVALPSLIPRINFIGTNRDTITCLVITSEREHELEQKGSGFRLQTAVEGGITLLRNNDAVTIPIHPEFYRASDIFENNKVFRELLVKLCYARIVVFDMTNYEPAVMFLLGVRSVVKRGVTICSLGGGFVIGAATDFPFNIKEVNFSSHSEEQFTAIEYELQPQYLLYIRMFEGLTNHTSTSYEDLPVFNGVRKLPKHKNRMIPLNEQILFLCSYSQRYQKHNWTFVKGGFDLQIRTRPDFNTKLRRVLDLQSPNMISTTIYEHIRRSSLCVIDFSGWRANVFFEFGVRCAIERNPIGTICVIDKDHARAIEKIAENPDQSEDIINEYGLIHDDDARKPTVIKRLAIVAKQCLQILELFDFKEYQCQILQEMPYREIIGAHSGEVSSISNTGIVPSDVYNTIAAHYEADDETFAQPVYQELTDAADLLEATDTPTVLYPANNKLVKIASEAVTEKYFAAWAYLDVRHGTDKIKTDENLAREYVDIGYKLILRLKDDQEAQTKVLEKMVLFDDQISSITEQEMKLAEKSPSKSFNRLVQVVEIYKTSGRVHRNNDQFETGLKNLQKGIEILERLQSFEGINASNRDKVRSLFAECYGQMGSIYNRDKRYAQASLHYQKGEEYEKNGTYNLSNRIVNTILADPSEIKNLSDDLDNLIEKMDVVDGERQNDFWAWLDYGQFNLLANKQKEAEEAYQNVIDLNPESWVYQTHFRVLDLLRNKLTDVEPTIADGITSIKENVLKDKMG